jgi:hypothetical protein
VIRFRLGLEDLATEPFDTTLGEQLYQQIIQPLEPALERPNQHPGLYPRWFFAQRAHGRAPRWSAVLN